MPGMRIPPWYWLLYVATFVVGVVLLETLGGDSWLDSVGPVALPTVGSFVGSVIGVRLNVARKQRGSRRARLQRKTTSYKRVQGVSVGGFSLNSTIVNGSDATKTFHVSTSHSAILCGDNNYYPYVDGTSEVSS
jgi:hypothetical protein